MARAHSQCFALACMPNSMVQPRCGMKNVRRTLKLRAYTVRHASTSYCSCEESIISHWYATRSPKEISVHLLLNSDIVENHRKQLLLCLIRLQIDSISILYQRKFTCSHQTRVSPVQQYVQPRSELNNNLIHIKLTEHIHTPIAMRFCKFDISSLTQRHSELSR